MLCDETALAGVRGISGEWCDLPWGHGGDCRPPMSGQSTESNHGKGDGQMTTSPDESTVPAGTGQGAPPAGDSALGAGSQHSGSQQDHTVTQSGFGAAAAPSDFAQNQPPEIRGQHRCVPPPPADLAPRRTWTCPECGQLWGRADPDGRGLLGQLWGADDPGRGLSHPVMLPLADVQKVQGGIRARTFRAMAAEVATLNRAKGWRDEPRSFGDMISLLHSEASEALDAYRDWKLEDATGPDGQVELDELDAEGRPVVIPKLAKPEGVGSELADVLIRLLDMCEMYGINLAAEYQRKMAYNWTRPYRHGGRTL